MKDTNLKLSNFDRKRKINNEESYTKYNKARQIVPRSSLF